MARTFSDPERAVLEIIQGNLPHSLRPFEDIAKMAGIPERDVLDLLAGLKASGVIRRFGATLRHQRAGWNQNAMVAWRVLESDADTCGEIARSHPNVSHAYFRPTVAPDWPYTFYTMIHGREENECLDVVRQLAARMPARDYAVLRSLRELKKTSMTYFA